MAVHSSGPGLGAPRGHEEGSGGRVMNEGDIFSQQRPSTRRRRNMADVAWLKSLKPPPPAAFVPPSPEPAQPIKNASHEISDRRHAEEELVEERPKKRRKKNTEDVEGNAQLAFTQTEPIIVIGPAPRVAPDQLNVPFLTGANTAFQSTAPTEEGHDMPLRPLSCLTARAWQPHGLDLVASKSTSPARRCRPLQFTQTEPAPRVKTGFRSRPVAHPRRKPVAAAARFRPPTPASVPRSGARSSQVYRDKVEQMRFSLTRQPRPILLAPASRSSTPVEEEEAANETPVEEISSKPIETPCPADRPRKPTFSFGPRKKLATTPLPLELHSTPPEPSRFVSAKQTQAMAKEAQLDLVTPHQVFYQTPLEDEGEPPAGQEAYAMYSGGGEDGHGMEPDYAPWQTPPGHRRRSILERGEDLAPTQPANRRRRRTLTALGDPAELAWHAEANNEDANELGWLGSGDRGGYIEQEVSHDVLAPRQHASLSTRDERWSRTSTTEPVSAPGSLPPNAQDPSSKRMLPTPSPTVHSEQTIEVLDEDDGIDGLPINSQDSHFLYLEQREVQERIQLGAEQNDQYNTLSFELDQEDPPTLVVEEEWSPLKLDDEASPGKVMVRSSVSMSARTYAGMRARPNDLVNRQPAINRSFRSDLHAHGLGVLNDAMRR